MSALGRGGRQQEGQGLGDPGALQGLNPSPAVALDTGMSKGRKVGVRLGLTLGSGCASLVLSFLGLGFLPASEFGPWAWGRARGLGQQELP